MNETNIGSGVPAEALRVAAPASKAGGATAVFKSLSPVLRQAGAVRGTLALKMLNQRGGFDCPSCAWPDPDGHRSATEFCENGAKAVASETTRRRITRSFFEKYSVSDLAAQSDHWHEQQGRLTEPFVLRAGSTHYAPISWEESFALLGESLRGVSDPNEAIFYTSGRTSNEAAFLYQLFARMFGTNNLPDCSNLCHESSGVALSQAIGVGKGTVSLDDLHAAELIVVVGQNPGTNHPRMLSSLQIAKENGARIISINPLREAGLKAFSHPQRVGQLLGGKTTIADAFVCPNTNGDQALFQGVAKHILMRAATEPHLVDHGFVKEYTAGFDEYVAFIAAADWSVLERLSGVRRDEIQRLADAFCESDKIITCWAMGLTQHRNAVATISEVANLHLLRGAIGKAGAGLCPVRGHSNVQGDRTMGIYEAMPPAFLDRLGEVFGFEPPRDHGHNVVHAIRAMRAGQARVFFAMGGNFVSASPDTNYTAEALRNCELTAHVSTKLNRSHLVCGKQALILPCLGRSEVDEQRSGPQSVSVENSMGVVSASRGRLEPASRHLKSEVAIVCGLARATLAPNTQVDWDDFEADYARIREKVARVIPHFEDFNQRLEQPGGFSLYNPVSERRFETKTGRANFTTHALDVEAPEPGKLLLMTMRSHDQYNTTIYGLDDRYRGIRGGRRVIFLNPQFIEQSSFTPEQSVDVTSHFHGATRTIREFQVIPYDIPESCAAMYFPEANPLVPLDHTAAGSDTPASKSVQITITPHERA